VDEVDLMCCKVINFDCYRPTGVIKLWINALISILSYIASRISLLNFYSMFTKVFRKWSPYAQIRINVLNLGAFILYSFYVKFNFNPTKFS